MKMEKHELLNALASFRKGRESLVAEFCNEEPRLYQPMFAYKPLSNDMHFAISRYVLSWLGQHPIYYQEIINKGEAMVPVELDGFIGAYRSLCEKFVVGEARESNDKSHVLEKVVKDLIVHLDSLLAISERADGRLEELRYQSEKSKHLFDRAVNEIRKGNNGIF